MNLTLHQIFGELKLWEAIIIFSLAHFTKGILQAMWKDLTKGGKK